MNRFHFFQIRSFSKTIVFKKLVVNNDPSLTIVKDDPLLPIVNDDPLFTIVNEERRREEIDLKGISSFKENIKFQLPQNFFLHGRQRQGFNRG